MRKKKFSSFDVKNFCNSENEFSIYALAFTATVTHSHFHYCRFFVCFNLLLPYNSFPSSILRKLSYCNCCAFERKRKITTVKIERKLHIKRGKRLMEWYLTIESLFSSCLPHILYFPTYFFSFLFPFLIPST